MEIILTLSVLTLALIAFIFEWFPVDLTAIMVAIVLMLLGLVTPEEGIAGFGNTATITVMAMFILSAGVGKTGAIQVVRDLLLEWGGKNAFQQIIVMGMIVGPISAFINNTAVVAIFIPVIEDFAKKQGIASSKLLMPLSFASILGGTLTLIGTSTNILASSLSAKLGLGEFSLFQFTKLGIIVFIIGLLYIAIAAPRILRNRQSKKSGILSEEYEIKDYVTEVVVSRDSSLIGQTLRESEIQRKFDIDVLEIIHQGVHFPQPIADKKIRSGDILLVRGSKDVLIQLKAERGIEILPDVKFNQEQLETELNTGEEKIGEVLILSNSRFIGATLKDLRFRQRRNATVLAIRRGEEVLRERLGKVPLRFGDLLLVQGPKQSFLGLQTSRELLVLEQKDVENLRIDKAQTAIAICLGVIVASAFNLIPILVSALAGVVLMVLTDCLKPGEIYGAVRWDVIFLLAGLIPLGTAMQNSGATEYLAKPILLVGSNLSGYWILLFFYFITTILTSILSNNAAVLLMIPIGVQVAQTLELNPFAIMFAVTFAASNSFMTPIAYQTNTMIYGPGGYKFTDFVRLGTPLSVIVGLITPGLIIWLYGL
ncbi:SLC13 family permease [Waterburya agarophytonicola K14]|uniref:SLC13 family permease n=1 Tax=Waterburya agarophytonicola KI4 TaxID=2874699 RepID=A0A964FE27_9CYAN|nr:SLC13 family permease [Waterburya agarophytonicola]MCC0175407.1 SLC13 family permease [Waterburya agarophytonicola KI4]